jgi:hypothetical protein
MIVEYGPLVLLLVAAVGVGTGLWLIRRITRDADDPPSSWRSRR